MKGRDMRSYVSRSVTDEGALQKMRMCLLERNTASKNWIKSADKITENHADFIIAVTGDSIRSELRTLLESVWISKVLETYAQAGAQLQRL